MSRLARLGFSGARRRCSKLSELPFTSRLVLPLPFGICLEGADEPAHAFAHRTQSYFRVLALPLSSSEISRRCLRAPSVRRTPCDPAVSTLRRGSMQLLSAASLSVLTIMLSRQSVCRLPTARCPQD